MQSILASQSSQFAVRVGESKQMLDSVEQGPLSASPLRMLSHVGGQQARKLGPANLESCERPAG